MAKRSRRAARSLVVATVAAGIAGVLGLPALYRQLHGSPTPTGTAVPGQPPGLALDTAGDTAADVSQSGSTTAKPFLKRWQGWLFHGVNGVVITLAVLWVVPLAYAIRVLPNTTVPVPQSSSVEVDFSQGHPAHSPISVEISFSREQQFDSNGWQMVMAIYLNGPDLAQAGWSITAIVPAGVQVNGAIGNSALLGRVLPYAASGTTDDVYIAPGPMRRGTYTALLIWNNLSSGPMQVNEANLAAAFPDVTVDNQSPSYSGLGPPPVPQPQMSVTRELVPFGDFAYFGGVPPNQLNDSAWSWQADTYPVNEGSGIFSPGLDVEARSPTLDASSSTNEFRSGIAFGIAAAAFIGFATEFVRAVSEARKRAITGAGSGIASGGAPRGEVSA
jgi:hypothetical protein